MSQEIDRIIAEALGDKIETEPECLRVEDTCPYTLDNPIAEQPCGDGCQSWGVRPPRCYSTNDADALAGIKAFKCLWAIEHETYAPGASHGMLESYSVGIKLVSRGEYLINGFGQTLSAAFADAMVELVPNKPPCRNMVWQLRPEVKKALEDAQTK